MHISIIIRTFNEAKHLGQLLDAINHQEKINFEVEVIVVDSGSTDGTLDIAKRYSCKIVPIKKEEFSFGRSLNLGCSSSRGEILVFISGHCIPVDNNWLKNLVQPIIEKRASYTYGKQRGTDETQFSELQLFKKYYPESRSNNINPHFCNNANAAITRDAWEQNGFDEELTGLEDMAMAKVLSFSGQQIEYVPDACVYHIHEESWSKIKLRYEREAIALHQIMPEIQVSLTDAIRYFISGVLFDFSESVREHVFVQNFFNIVMFRAMQYYGTYKGNHLNRTISRQMKEEYFYPR